MLSDLMLFWFVALTSAFGLARALRHPVGSKLGWSVVFGAILAQSVLGQLLTYPILIRAAAIEWLVFVLSPGLLARIYFLRLQQQRYRAATRYARAISILHPIDGWREQLGVVHALDLAQRGELSSAIEILEKYKSRSEMMALSVAPALFRLTGRWEEMLEWEQQHQHQVGTVPNLLQARLRARGETGDINGMLELYNAYRAQIAKLPLKGSAALCRLSLFVFCGQRELAERLFRGSLSMLPLNVQKFWLASADLYAGNIEKGRLQLCALLNDADPGLRLVVERRLEKCPTAGVVLSPRAREILAAAAVDQQHEHTYVGNNNLFAPSARATLALIILNCVMFGVEVFAGGGSNSEVLYKLGALYWPAVTHGEWWRVIACNFLHFGLVHLSMNMVGLAILGPFVEESLGAVRYVAVYLLSGVGAMALVGVLQPHEFAVGASGAIMALIGATGAILLRGWLRNRVALAKRRFMAMLGIIVLQSVFDFLIPEISMTAHLSGAALGFVLTMLVAGRKAEVE